MTESIVGGFFAIMQWGNIGAIIIGLYIGVLIGALPGLSPSMAIALATPFTFGLNPIAGLSFLLGVYKGGVYGGSISAILISTPGTPEAAATLLDGYPLVKQGKARKALDAALFASIAGDFIGTLLLVSVAPVIAYFALKIGPHEMLPLIILSLSVIIITLGKNKVKGFIAASIGGMIAMIGVDPMEGSSRFVFDIYELNEGISLIPFLVGLFAIPEIILAIVERRPKKNDENKVQVDAIGVGNDRLSFQEFFSHWKTVVRSAIMGGGIGALPGLGSTAATFICYGLAKKISKEPEEYGKGSVEGLLACETGNNGTCGPALIPLITLGIPGSSTAAVLYGSLMMHGIVPGPRIFIEHGTIVFAVFIGLFMGAFLLYPVALSVIKYAAKWVYKINQGVLFGGIFLLCFTGSYAIKNSIYDVLTMCFAGILGYVMRGLGFSLGPTLIAFILTPMLERSFRQGMLISGNDIVSFFTQPVAAGIWIILAFTLVYGPVRSFLKSRRHQ